MMSDSHEQNIIDLQVRVAFQEETLYDMSSQMAALTRDLQLAREQIQLLSNKVKNGSEDQGLGAMPANERPPHY